MGRPCVFASCCVGARSCIAAETRGGEEMNALSTSVEDVDSLGACTDALDGSGRGDGAATRAQR
jgi:hypothetical protein